MAAMTDASDPATAYERLAGADTGPALSTVERAQLSQLLDELGPHAPTLAGAWDTHHLAAHLVIREGNPLTALTSALTSRGDETVEQRVAETPYTELVDRLRAGPPRLSTFAVPRLEQAFNALEFLVHHEDVRRAQPGWQPRALPRWAEDQVWARLSLMAKLVARKCDVAVRLVRSDDVATITAHKGPAPALVTGLPSEITLYMLGRQEVAGVGIDGPADAVRRLGEQDFSV